MSYPSSLRRFVAPSLHSSPSLALRALLAALALVPRAASQTHIEYERPVEAAPQEKDIGGGYVTPVVQFHLPRPQWREIADVGLLAAGLGLSTWLMHRRRSRTGLLLLAIGSLAYFGFHRQGCVCPIGAIQNVAVALLDPRYVISYVVIAIFLLPLVFAVFAGRVFCGGVCALGAIQELVLLRPVEVPRQLDRALGLAKWVYLALALWFVFRPANDRDFLICRYDPFVGFFRFAGPLSVHLLGLGLLVLGLFVGRPYCRYLCPYGALLSLFARLAWKPVSITPNKELDCGLCAEACPYGAIENFRAARATCLSCARCFRHCPRHRVQTEPEAQGRVLSPGTAAPRHAGTQSHGTDPQ